MFNDTEKLKAIVFSAVFAIVCGVGISLAVFFAGASKVPESKQAGIVFNEPKIKVHVKGEVKNPGVFEFSTNKRVQDAIDAAGGTLETGDTNDLNLASILKDGQTITVRTRNAAADASVSTAETKENTEATSGGKININTANAEELEKLPGIGPSLAQRIINYRNQNGNFQNIEDIINVSGIGEKKFEQMRDYISN